MSTGGGVPVIRYGAYALDFWSSPLTAAIVTNPAANIALQDVIVAGLPTSVTIQRAIAMFKFRAVENTNVLSNTISGAQFIAVQKGGTGGYTNAITIPAFTCTLTALTREGGDVWLGNININALLTGNDTYNFRWVSALSTLATMVFNDIQTGLRVWYSY